MSETNAIIRAVLQGKLLARVHQPFYVIVCSSDPILNPPKKKNLHYLMAIFIQSNDGCLYLCNIHAEVVCIVDRDTTSTCSVSYAKMGSWRKVWFTNPVAIPHSIIMKRV